MLTELTTVYEILTIHLILQYRFLYLLVNNSMKNEQKAYPLFLLCKGLN